MGETPEPRPSTFYPALALILLMIAAKTVLVWEKDIAPSTWAWQVVAVSWQDMLVLVPAALAAACALGLLQSRPRLQARLWRLLLAAGTAWVVYTVVHVGFYESFRRSINVQMMKFAGNVGDLRSSVLARLTLPYVLAVTLLPALFVLAFRRPRRGPPWPLRAGAGVLALAWVSLGRHWRDEVPWLEWMDRMGPNPQWVLLASVVTEVRGGAGITLEKDYGAEDLLEFRTFAERGRAGEPAPAPRVKNVIVVVLESTGTRYLSLYGSRYDTTPRLAAEARNALVFDNAHAAVGYTYCSFQALVFSLYPGLPWCYLPCGERPLPPTLPGILRGRGYRTALLSSADLSYEGMGYAAEHSAGIQDVKSYWDLGCANVSSWGSSDRCMFEGVLKYLDERPGQPFYVMAWTNQPHDPYVMDPKDPLIPFQGPDTAEHNLGKYLNILHASDEGLGLLLDGLRARGLAEDTLVVVTGDHGEAFGEPHDYAGHGSALFDEVIKVPLVFWNPRLFAGAGRNPRIGSHVDLNPTLAELLGVPAVAGWQGTSLFDPKHPGRATFHTGLGEYRFGLREGQFKYVYNATFGREELFDLGADPEEQANVATRHPELAARLRRRIAAWISYEEYFLKGQPGPHLP